MITSSQRRQRTASAVVVVPILLEWYLDENILRIGYVGDSQPKQVITVHASSTSSTSDYDHKTIDEWYRCYIAPAMEKALHSILQDDSKLRQEQRKILLLVDHSSKNFQKALNLYFRKPFEEDKQQQQADSSTSLVHVHSALEFIPMSFPNRQDLLLVYLGSRQMQVLAHASGQNLPYTYQSVPIPATLSKIITEQEWKENTTSTTADETTLSSSAAAVLSDVFLNEHNPLSLISAILACLMACPRESRPSILSNLVLTGSIPFAKATQVRIVQALRRVLLQKEDPKLAEQTFQSSPMSLSRVPLDPHILTPYLASRVRVIYNAGGHPTNSLAAWMGASAWAHEHKDWYAQQTVEQ